jgi:putative endonuclease
MKSAHVYILASQKNGTLYIGVTSGLVRRIHEHREGLADGFTKKYGVKTLVHFEEFVDIRNAIEREKRLKKWKRAWKLRLIEEGNPEWRDLYDEIVG